MLIVTTNLYDDFRGFNIDSHLHKPVQMVVMNDMLLNAANEGGKYKSWTPYVQSPNVANEPTVDADTLVFDITTADYVEFTDSVQTQKIGDYVVAKIDPDKPFLKTAIASMDGFTLHPGDPGSLLVFDDAILERGSITLNVVMRSADGSEGTVVFSSGGEKREVSVNADYQSYEITLPVNDGGFFSFQIQPSSDVFIAEYSTT